MDKCETCVWYVYDEDYDDYICDMDLDEDELARRRKDWVCPEPRIKTGYLARYAKMVSSADRGAILE